ncbi:MAG: DUF6361 family protein [Terrimicrobiaceae bacterium]
MSNASIGWIDFSSEHRERVRTVLDLLSVPGVTDELGIRPILIAFSDRMFPGISTIQTRAKYFALTAHLIRDYLDKERAKRNPRPFRRYLEQEELQCRIRLVENGKGRRNLGIIGSDFGTRTDRDVVRRASSVYWNGLQRFGFVSPDSLSLAEFGRRVSDDQHRLRTLLEGRGDERGDDNDAGQDQWAIRVLAPDKPKHYFDDLTIDLTAEEADFLRHQITAHVPQSLLGQILAKNARMDQVRMLQETNSFEAFAELPFLEELKDEELRGVVIHARDFWRILDGAHIRYNCLLQEAGFGNGELKDQFEQEWKEWRREIRNFPEAWNTSFLWATVQRNGTRVRDATRRFVDNWIEEARAGAPNLERCNELVRRQECSIKLGRARLRPGKKESVSERIGLNGANYRLPVVAQLVRDIYAGERRKSNA